MRHCAAEPTARRLPNEGPFVRGGRIRGGQEQGQKEGKKQGESTIPHARLLRAVVAQLHAGSVKTRQVCARLQPRPAIGML